MIKKKMEVVDNGTSKKVIRNGLIKKRKGKKEEEEDKEKGRDKKQLWRGCGVMGRRRQLKGRKRKGR